MGYSPPDLCQQFGITFMSPCSRRLEYRCLAPSQEGREPCRADYFNANTIITVSKSQTRESSPGNLQKTGIMEWHLHNIKEIHSSAVQPQDTTFISSPVFMQQTFVRVVAETMAQETMVRNHCNAFTKTYHLVCDLAGAD